MYHFIYKTTNTLNNRYYIGMHSTKNLDDGYIGSGTNLRRAIKKYGKEVFRFEILQYLSDRKSLREREIEIVNEDLLKDTYCMNLKPGGYGGFCNEEHRVKCSTSGNKVFSEKFNHDEELRERFRQNGLNTQRKLDERGTRKIPNWNGKKHKEETKIKIGQKNSIIQNGSKNSQFGTMWITDGIKNSKITNGSKIPDGWKTGRTLISISGENNKTSKLTTNDVVSIKELLDKKIQHKIIAEQFNVHPETICKIRRGVTWRTVYSLTIL